MFNRIFIKKNKITESSVDLGKLCETLLFYDQTDFLLDKFNAEQFVKSIDIEKLIGIFQFPKGHKTGIGSMVTKSEAFNLEQYVNKGFLSVYNGDKTKSDKKTIEFLELCLPQVYTNDFQKLLESETEDISLLTSQLKVGHRNGKPKLKTNNDFGTNLEIRF